MKTWIVTTDANISPLLQMATGEVVTVAVGDRPVGGANIRIPAGDLPVEALIPSVLQAVEAEAGDMILVLSNAEGKAIAGALAAAKDAPLLHGLISFDQGTAKLARYGGLTIQNVEFAGVAVALVEAGEPVEDDAEATAQAAAQTYPMRITQQQIGEGERVNLAAQKRIVGVGRGFKAREDLDLARELAAALGGQIGCTRPLVEGNGWLDRDYYLGVSGHTVAPEVYIPVGISGQIHHTAGIDQSGTIVAINNDETATIFEFADYGIVGDLYEILPALTKALKEG